MARKVKKRTTAGIGISRTAITTSGAVVGIAVGSFGMWLAVEDRAAKAQKEFELRIRDQVIREMRVENRLTRLEERYEALKTTVWNQETWRQKESAAPAVVVTPAVAEKK